MTANRFRALELKTGAMLEAALRFLVGALYRVQIEGQENLPEKGGALLVANHLAFVDPLLLLSASRRSIRFLMLKDYYVHPLLRPFARLMGSIPIASDLKPREMVRSLREAGERIREGHLVCIFAEGQMTRTGDLLPFHRGLEVIMKDVDAPIVPVHLGGVWGSIFSNERGRYIWKLPLRIPYPVRIRFGKAMPSTSTAAEAHAAVEQLS